MVNDTFVTHTYNRHTSGHQDHQGHQGHQVDQDHHDHQGNEVEPCGCAHRLHIRLLKNHSLSDKDKLSLQKFPRLVQELLSFLNGILPCKSVECRGEYLWVVIPFGEQV